MTLIKYIISIFLVLVISMSGIPCFMVEDASRDSIIDLKDVILQVQDFSGSAENSDSFVFNYEKMLNTLSSVAGIKTVVNPNNENSSSKHQSKFVINADKITNSFALHLPLLLISREEHPDNSVIFESRYLDPSSPPPRFS